MRRSCMMYISTHIYKDANHAQWTFEKMVSHASVENKQQLHRTNLLVAPNLAQIHTYHQREERNPFSWNKKRGEDTHELSDIKHRGSLVLLELLLGTLGEERPQAIHIDRGAVELLRGLVEVTHTDLSEVSRMAVSSQKYDESVNFSCRKKKKCVS